jgi:hypothetical protein
LQKAPFGAICFYFSILEYHGAIQSSALNIINLIVNRKSGSLKAYRIHLSSVVNICHQRLASEFFPCHSKAKMRRRQKPIGALNSARIGEEAKPKKNQKIFLKNW